MEKSQIVDNLLMHFSVKELVCSHVYDIHGENSWLFLDEKILYILMILRNDVFKSPILINNWHTFGTFSQRGLRCPFCLLNLEKKAAEELYLSAHNFGQAFDFDVQNVSADQARRTLYFHYKELKYPIRLERNVNWVHLDTFNNLKGVGIYEFSNKH